MRVVLDASVAVASIFPDDPVHAAARARMRSIFVGEHTLFLPSIFMAEVVSGARRQGSPIRGVELARLVADLARVQNISRYVAERAAGIAAAYPIRGMDAIYALIAVEYGATLITSDRALRDHAPCKTAKP